MRRCRGQGLFTAALACIALAVSAQELQPGKDYGVVTPPQKTDDPSKLQLRLRDRLLEFARGGPRVPEAARAVVDAAEISETLGKTEDARHCYRYLLKYFSKDPLARKASVSLRRLAARVGIRQSVRGLAREVLRP